MSAAALAASPIDLAKAITTTPTLVAGASYVAVPPSGMPNAVSSTPLAGFPNHGGTYSILTTGDANLAATPNDSTNTGADDGGGNVRGDTDFDVTILKIDLKVPAGANCLIGLRFRFLSDEYPEYVGSMFNDAFIAELDSSTWTTSGSQISAPGNFAFDPKGNPITINAAGVTSMTAQEAVGTTYDGATPLLTAATPISPGSHSLYLSIFDQGDHVYDAAVFLDSLEVGKVANVNTDCKPGATPISPNSFKYVALGDSFSAGEGVAPFFEPWNRCHRSQKAAYPLFVELPGLYGSSIYDLHRAKTPGIQWGFQACSGATTDNVMHRGKWGDPLPQLRLDRRADRGNLNDLPVDSGTDLVTITIGGNNVHFNDVLRFCVFSNDCTTELYQGRPLAQYAREQRDALSPQLDAVYSRIRAQAKKARIVVMGYPHLLPASPQEQNCGKLAQRSYFRRQGLRYVVRSIGFSQREQNYLRQATSELNQLIAARVSKNGTARFVPVDGLFAGHEVCGGKGEWVNGVSLSITSLGVNDQSFHPNESGQHAYAAAVNLVLNPRF
ncbi:MAG: SGNH/GDSL hydrolase family protein [Actinomycetota bacterium]|nr:SGNH/GDSL hydrolase family protein [Actinomycetota bacterium]